MSIAVLKLLRQKTPQSLKNIYHWATAWLAALYFGRPATHLKLIGVTGTDGKTTTCYLIHSILQKAGFRTGIITSIGTKIQGQDFETGLHVTTPSPWQLQAVLQKMVRANEEYVVLEVTSHALDQHRVAGLTFEVGVITNITPEHLDYHQEFENYVLAKAKILTMSKRAVLNYDDKTYANLKKLSPGPVLAFSLKPTGLKNVLSFPQIKDQIQLNLPGRFNQQNALAAMAVGEALSISPQAIQEGVKAIKKITGRLEVVFQGEFMVIIDFAHTPHALREALPAVRQLWLASGQEAKRRSPRLILVFGAAGLRDRQKRPLMGKVAAELADLIVLTAEDPRTENIEDIIGQISAGIPCPPYSLGNQRLQQRGRLPYKKYYKIADRQQAINFAITRLVQPGDVVILTGKGHEKSMCYGETEHAWSEHEAVKKALHMVKLAP